MLELIRRHVATAARFLACVLAQTAILSGAAEASRDCPGTYQSSSLSQLPAAASVQIQIVNQTPTNLRLAERFAAGLSSAGVAVNPQGNVTLNLVFTVGSASAAAGRPYQDFGWADNLAESGSGFGPGTTLNMTAQVTDTTTAQIDWISSLSCTIQTDDLGALAEYLGAVVGRSLGQSTDNGTI
jgi:hypothetical protein